MSNVTHLLTMVYENYWAAVKRLQAPFDRYAHWRRVARTIKLSRKACQRLEWIIYYQTRARKNASLTCRHFGIAPKVWYTWKNRFDPSNLRTREDKGKAPRNKRQREITQAEEQRIIQLRKAHILSQCPP